MAFRATVLNPGGHPLTAIANEAIADAGTALKLVAVTGSEDFRLGIADTAASDIIVGVSVDNDVASGDSFAWQPLGMVLEVLAGDAVTLGAEVTCESGGRWIATTTVGDYVGGIALKVGADGEAMPVLVGGHFRFAATS